MGLTKRVRKILTYYETDNVGSKTNLCRLLMQGKLGGSGRLIIYPVDQGFEQGPKTFIPNTEAFHPHYHYKLAIETGLSAYAAPLGWLEAGADTFVGQIPTILKINSGNTLYGNPPDQAITSSIEDALRLGCIGIGFTIYPGSDQSLEQFEEVRELSAEAKACGLIVVIWSYPRNNMSKAGETSLDVISYSAHIAALLGAHIIKVKLPSDHLEKPDTQELYPKYHIASKTLEDRIRHVVQCCFQGRRLVIFSGGEKKDEEEILSEAGAIVKGTGHGSIIGRNCFQRPRNEALRLLKNIIKVFKT